MVSQERKINDNNNVRQPNKVHTEPIDIVQVFPSLPSSVSVFDEWEIVSENALWEIAKHSNNTDQTFYFGI